VVCVRLRIYTPRERSTERAFIPSLLFFFSFLSAHLVALSYSSRPVHARARVVVVVVGGVGGGGGVVLCGVREVLFSDCLCGALARVFFVFFTKEEGEGEVQKKKVFESFPGEGKKKKRRESKRVRDFCRRFCCLSFFFGPLDLFERYKSYGHILYYYSFVWTNTLLLLLNKKRQKRPTNPTIFSASLTSPASPRGSSSVGR